MTRQTLNLTSELYEYILDHGLQEAQIAQQLREHTASLPGAVMQISPEQGQFFTFLLKLINAKQTIDIGTYTGYSALIAALALPDDGKVITCDIDEKATSVAKAYWQQANVAQKIDLYLQPAQDTLNELIQQGAANSFDFIFIDADKRAYETYYELGLELIRPGGCIAVDNVLWSGKVADSSVNDPQTQALRDFNQHVAKDQRVVFSLLPVSDGITLVTKI